MTQTSQLRHITLNIKAHFFLLPFSAKNIIIFARMGDVELDEKVGIFCTYILLLYVGCRQRKRLLSGFSSQSILLHPHIMMIMMTWAKKINMKRRHIFPLYLSRVPFHETKRLSVLWLSILLNKKIFNSSHFFCLFFFSAPSSSCQTLQKLFSVVVVSSIRRVVLLLALCSSKNEQ